MEKTQKYTKLIYAILAVIVILGFQTHIIRAEGVDYVEDAKEKREILWLARVVYSETKKSNEQVLVAWIVRNRVETGFRGTNYEEVAKSPAQFSGLNPGDAQYRHNISRNYESEGKSWRSALEIAKAVYRADESLRPFPISVRHFYSPRSVTVHPDWSADTKPVLLIKDNENKEIRFAFYDLAK